MKYYVHYVDCELEHFVLCLHLCVSSPVSLHTPVNKRLDEWVTEDRIDASKVFFPKKESKHLKNTSSRPASPDASDLPWPACNLKKNISIARKRKIEAANNVPPEVNEM